VDDVVAVPAVERVAERAAASGLAVVVADHHTRAVGDLERAAERHVRQLLSEDHAVLADSELDPRGLVGGGWQVADDRARGRAAGERQIVAALDGERLVGGDRFEGVGGHGRVCQA
jgi:hypothetical protein